MSGLSSYAGKICDGIDWRTIEIRPIVEILLLFRYKLPIAETKSETRELKLLLSKCLFLMVGMDGRYSTAGFDCPTSSQPCGVIGIVCIISGSCATLPLPSYAAFEPSSASLGLG